MSTLTTTILAMALATFAPPIAEGADSESEESPAAFIKRWVATLNENKAKKLLAFYDRSESTEVVVSSGHRHRGYAAISRIYVETFKNVRFSDSKSKKMAVRLLDGTAIVTFEHLFKIRSLADDGSKSQAHIRTSSVLHKSKAGGWRIVLEHSSPIHGVSRLTPLAD